ncbi:MAG: DUF465 domain-containing protein [Nitrospiraceae bacterium]|nr:MAG: DUF465 domain-containing protein [Nitrospiraceae bacterium]
MKEADIIAVLRSENEEFRRLEDEHRTMEKTLDEMNKKRYLTADEEVDKKKMQKQKLHCKDRMAELIREYKQGVKN